MPMEVESHAGATCLQHLSEIFLGPTPRKK